ncbi:MAG: Methyltransferase type 11 [Candidatus Solibacter sp.]|nr:Methyltransferase type 11 [Candidatus Solibacter sp.]
MALFDRLAARYDEAWTNTAVGRAQRDQVWREVDGLFRAGERILDIGCGTGEDAAHFAARGVDVYGIDASPAMIELARGRGGFRAEVCRAEEVGRIGGTFDGAISNFGALNCVEDLARFAGDLAELVRPGGCVAICLLGRFCAWESLYYGACLQWGKATRRWRGRAAAEGLTVRYPTTREVRQAFARGFELQRWIGIGAFVPPSYVKLPVGWLAAWDEALAYLPVVRAAADHRLFLFVRKSC